jgi:hypothetical protein
MDLVVVTVILLLNKHAIKMSAVRWPDNLSFVAHLLSSGDVQHYSCANE